MKKGDVIQIKKLRKNGVVIDIIETDRGQLLEVEVEGQKGPEIIVILQTTVTVISLLKEIAGGIADIFRSIFKRKKEKKQLILTIEKKN
jgi:hypothetical protein